MPDHRQPDLPALTSLRFFAALAIVIHHCNGVFWPAAALGPLDVGVSFFFVLSGFILTCVYRATVFDQPALMRFYRARVARIWPLHVVCLLLTCWLIRIPEPFDAGVLTANTLLLHAWIPFDRYFFSYNYVSWSISTELFFYLLLPFLLKRPRRLAAAIMLALSLVIALALASDLLALPQWNVSGNRLSSTGLLYSHPLARLAEFLGGIATALIFLKRRSDAAASRLRWTLLEFAGVGLLLLAYRYLFSAFDMLQEYLLDLADASDSATAAAQSVNQLVELLAANWGSHVLLAPFAAGLIYIFARQRGTLSWLLSHRLPVALGEISFALYLVHQIALRWLQQHVLQPDWRDFGVYMVAIMLLAGGLHLLIERPARSWLAGRKGNRASLPTHGRDQAHGGSLH